MAKLIWSREAAYDVQRLYRFLEKSNPAAATRAVAAIRAGARRLHEFPEIGRPVKRENSSYRDLLIGFGARGYVLRYRLEGDLIVVVLVRHQLEQR